MLASRPGEGRSRHPAAFSRDAVHDHIYSSADKRAGEWPVAVRQPVAGGAEQHVEHDVVSLFAGISPRSMAPVEQDPVPGSRRFDHPVAPGN
jgi:hypothetical protein